MPFDAGRVSFRRFLVRERGSDAPPANAPSLVDETTLAILAEHAFQESSTPTEIESGFLAGEHLFDTRFSYEKNGFADMLLFGLRVDTHRVPADVKQAYRRMQEDAILNQSDQAKTTGFLSRSEKRQAKEEAERQLREELSTGKFRRSKQVPLLWDLKRHIVYCAANGDAIGEQLTKRFRECFNLDLSPLTPGAVASQWLGAAGRHRDYEDMRPTAFTRPPAEGAAQAEAQQAAGGWSESPADTPLCPWLPPTYESRDFLGNEWLIWLWWMIEAHEGVIPLPKSAGENSGASGAEAAVMIDQTLDTECAWGMTGKQSLRADGPTRLPEAAEALASGKWPRKAKLIVADLTEGDQWTFTLQADLLQVSAATLPEGEEVTNAREAIEQRLTSIRRLSATLDGLFTAYIERRASQSWDAQKREITRWIRARRRPAKGALGETVGQPVEVTV